MDSSFSEQVKRYRVHESWINYIVHDLDLSSACIFYRFVKRFVAFGQLDTEQFKAGNIYYITIALDNAEIESTIMHELKHVKQREERSLVSIKSNKKWITVWNADDVSLYFDGWVYKQKYEDIIKLPWEQDAIQYEKTYPTKKQEYKAKSYQNILQSTYFLGKKFVGMM